MSDTNYVTTTIVLTLPTNLVTVNNPTSVDDLGSGGTGIFGVHSGPPGAQLVYNIDLRHHDLTSSDALQQLLFQTNEILLLVVGLNTTLVDALNAP